jgi:protein phosphatase
MVEIAEETRDDVSTAAVEIIPGSPVTAVVTPSETAGPPGQQPPAAEAKPAVTTEAEETNTEKPGTAKAAAEKTDAEKPDEAKTGTEQPAKDESQDSTDPHLGEHLSAEVLREELASRPHELVGAAASAAQSGSIPTIAGRTVARRAATVLTHKAEQPASELDDSYLASTPRRWVTWSIAASVLVVLTVGLWLGYAWTQTRYYIGEYDSRVAIFNGVSQRLGPIQLSSLEAVTEIRMDSLPPFSQQRVRQTVPARDLYDAQRIVKNLERTGTTSPSDDCPTASPAPTATTSPASPAPTEAAAAAPAPSDPAATPPPASPSPSPTVTCEGAP